MEDKIIKLQQFTRLQKQTFLFGITCTGELSHNKTAVECALIK